MTEQQEKEVADVTAENEVQDADLGDHEPNIGKISSVSCATGSSHPTSDVSTNRGMLACKIELYLLKNIGIFRIYSFQRTYHFTFCKI